MMGRFAWLVSGVTAASGPPAGGAGSAPVARPPVIAPEPLPALPPSQLGARIAVPIETLRSAALQQAGINSLPMVLKDTTLRFAVSPRDAARASEMFIALPVEIIATTVVDRLQRPAGFVLRQFA